MNRVLGSYAGPVTQHHRARLEFLPADRLEVERLGQPREEAPSTANDAGMDDELVLVDQPQLHQRQRHRHAAHGDPPARPRLELAHELAQVAAHQLGVSVHLRLGDYRRVVNPAVEGHVDGIAEGAHGGSGGGAEGYGGALPK